MMSLNFKFGVILGILFISGINLVSSQLQQNAINCYKCEGDQCTSQLGSIDTCIDDVNQSCVTVFSENKSSIIARGCSNKISIKYKSYCEKDNAFCKTCQREKCNTDIQLRDSFKCYKCYGDCQDAQSEECSNDEEQCYFKFDEQKDIIKMGCRSEINDDELVALVKSKNLYLCNGTECNYFDKLPAEFHCKQCNSETDANCAVNATKISKSVSCKGPYSQCYSMVSGGKTHRGCLTELSDEIFYQCLTNNIKDCLACIGNDCNEQMFKNDSEVSDNLGESVGEPGLWQDLPLNCFTCDGEPCATSNGLLKKCLNNDLQTCITIFNQVDKVTARGCSDDIANKYQSYCEENPSNCLQCKSSGCNLATSKVEYIDCIHCDSKTNVNCNFDIQNVNETRKCHTSCMTALYPRTSDEEPSYNLIRTCLDDKDLDDRETCDSEELCQSCSNKSLCNTDILPNKDRKVCLHCEGESCQMPIAGPCQSYTKFEQCFIEFDNQTTISKIGCKSDYDPTEIKSLLLSKKLFLCDEDECNKIENLPKAHLCRLCNSRTDRFCATEPQNVASSTKCDKLPNTSCYTRLLGDGHTERGCLSSLEDNQFLQCYNNNTADCIICDEENCNDMIFPAERLACHVCNSSEDAKCDEKPNDTTICNPFSNNQKCITSFANGITHRGCSADISCDPNDTLKCRICNTTDCNVANLKRFNDVNPGLWQSLPLNCYTCSGDDCQTPLGRLNMCTGNDKQYCMTVFDSDSKLVRRGCSDDVEEEYNKYCDHFSDKCFNCNSNGCNNATSLNEYISCMHCDARINKDCVQDLSTFGLGIRRCNTACMVALLPRSLNEPSIFELIRSCLDDKDLDDRETCGHDESLCRSCYSDSCNQFDVFDDRLECFSCSNGNCDNPISKKCPFYTANDTCFILFDEWSNDDIKQSGCTSEFRVEDLEQHLDRMIKCEGKNCNDHSIIPEPQICYACDSNIDVKCASSPTDVTTVNDCNILPNVECYVKTRSDGSTIRGCVSELIKFDRQACLNGNDENCSACFGNKCNVGVFPENRLSCHKCNSLDDPTCEDKPNSPIICPVYSETEVCSTKLVNSVTYRGCGDDFTCDDSDKQHCKMCNSSNCNVINLYKNNIGYPGNWQDLPINCYTCIDDECDNSATTLLKKCDNNNLQNCVTVFNDAGKVVQRGCSDTINNGKYDKHCDENSNLCTYCKSTGCNDAKNLNEFVDCLFCDSATNSNCTSNAENVSRSRKCKNKCMTSLYPRSDEPDPAFELSRTCLDDKDLDDRIQCENGNDALCKACESSNCNKDKLPEKRLSCLRCAGDCEDPVESVCPAYRENDLCYILFDNLNEVVQMGCKSDFDNSSLNLLAKKLLFCEGDNCNGFEIIPSPHTCLVCNSTEDLRCATNPDVLSSFKRCNDLPYTACYSKIDNDGHTIRGCIADLEMETINKCTEKNSDNKCSACDSAGCNNLLYPENRQLCYRCSSNDNENCHSNPIDTSACPLYQEDDQCVVKIFGNTTNRGCRSEIGCNADDRETCRLCPSNNCNTVDLYNNYIGKPGQWQDLPINCYTCEDAASCQRSNGVLKMCENNNLQKCETVFDGTTKLVVRRGCSDDVAKSHGEFCDNNKQLCQQCKSSGCNTVKSLDEYVDCVFCDSASDRNCVLNVNDKNIKTRKCNKQCMTALYPKSLEEDPSYELSRSCLDDKDFDDREECLDGKQSNCHACMSERCNSNEFPIDRHECLTCQGQDNCEDAQTQKCLSYHPNDQCYILFDNTSSIIAMGCRSEYEHQTVTNLVKAKKMLLCEGKNCNQFEIIPSPKSCIVCHSANDTRCATNPNLVEDSKTCSQLPYTGCYTLITEEGDTVRGCQSTLENEAFYSCHTQSNHGCNICSENKCNSAVYPSNRTSCHRCNSLDDGEKCSKSPSSNGVCPKYNENESCVTSYVNGVTYRGCSSELSCDETNKNACRICSSSGCNTVNLEYVANDGEPGKWQDLPIKCYTCKGESCKQTQVPVEQCDNNNLQNCMTVFDAQGIVIQRGCSDSVNEEQESYCENNSDKCYRCNSNECNTATQLSDYVQCLSCDSNSVNSCVASPESVKNKRMCNKKCMTALYPKYSEDDPAYNTIRTCLDDKELVDQQNCGADFLCKSCEGKDCNVEQIPKDRRSCYRCSGDNCQLPKTELCPSYRTNDECSLLLDEHNSIIEAGCKSDFSNAQAVALIKAKRLLLCTGNDCNTFESIPNSQKCRLCNSRTDPDCAISPSSVTSDVTCKRLPYTQCYTRVLSDGATERGCLSNLENNEFYDCLIGNSTTCKSCSGDGCNNQIYPEGRKMCHVCESDSDPTCHTNPNSLSICPKYNKNDACVTAFIDGETHRGCESSIQCDFSDRKKCRICQNDGCNTVNLERKQDENFGKWQDLPLECYDCKGDACNGPLETVKKCENNNEQDCSIIYDAEGNVIRRGCNDEVEDELEQYCDQNSDLCFNCKSNRCNGEILPSEFTECVYCDSSQNKSCVVSPTSVTKTRLCTSKCMTALYPSDSSSNPSYDLIRTCLNDKEQTDQNACTEPLCQSCSGKNCNTNNIPKDRLQCYSCNGETCENPVSELCPLYKKDDQCFVRFDSSNSITEMGCLSEFRSQDIVSILKTKRVHICNGKDCNSLENLPQVQKCVTCDSKSDVNCAIDPQQIGTVGTCNSLPYPNCHTSIASDGTTHRGCLADLPADDFASCILSGGEKCTQCLGNVCNKEIFPKTRLQCYSCNSEYDEDCEDMPTKLSSCPYIRESEHCVTALGGNRTDRGCSSQVLCDATDKSTCRHCSTSGCNTINLYDRGDDENHGMWQELPLKCHNCTGSECLKSLGPQVICADGDHQDCVTVFDEQGVVVRRGCTYDVEDEKDLYCRKNPDKCISCKSNACNDAWTLSDFETCEYCNSATDATCVTQPTRGNFSTRKCQNGCMAATFTATNGSLQVIRTCLDDKEILDRNQCSAGVGQEANTKCLSCSGDHCNLFNYPEDRLGCHVCNGSCTNTIAEYCATYDTSDKCYAKYENGKVVHSGCSSEHENSLLQEWRERNQLYDCSEENCNSPEKLPIAQNCVACDSSKSVECATNPTLINSTSLCNAPITSCMTLISSTITHRGCLNSLVYSDQINCGTGSGLCEQCSGQKCNSKIYPSDRRSCYICRSDQHDNCVKEPNAVSICPFYSQNNQCVTRFDGKVTERGCSTELTCDVQDEKHCKICNNDACNTDQLDGAMTIFANNLLLTILVAIVGLRAVKSQYI